MNVFEDLVVELKEEKLLEETVAFPPKTNGNGNGSAKTGVKSSNGNGNGNGHKSNSSSNGSHRKEMYRPQGRPEASSTNLSDQISGFQFVEFVISASERLDGSPKLPFDDLQVQKAFHRYTQTSSEPESNEYFEAESALIDSMRSWEDDLVKRDAAVPVGTIRHYAESANPPLSPQALFALVRFYRSVPVSENSYLKFDFVVTRVFSKFVDGERRDMLCPRADVVRHLSERYSDWGMNAFVSLPPDDPDVAMVCLSFDDFAIEVQKADRLSELVNANVFERLYEFKRSSGAMFFVPQVTAAAIEANLKISRKVHDLIANETKRGGLAKLSGVNNELTSNAIARTFEIENGIEASSQATARVSEMPSKSAQKHSTRVPKPAGAIRSSRSRRSNLFGVNPWLLMATILSVVVSIGIYVWSEYYTSEPTSNATVRVVDVEQPDLKQYIKTSKVSGDMLYAVVTPQYSEMTPDKRRDVVQQVRQLGETKGYKRVTFFDAQGKTVAYGSVDRTDIH